MPLPRPLTDILGKRPGSQEAVRSRAAIMETGMVPAILARQNEDGSWGDPQKPYHDKYRGTVWQLIMLAEHHADGSDGRVHKGCELLLSTLQDRESFGFAVNRAARTGGGRHSEVIPCLTGNMTWALLRLGYRGDPRVQGALEWIARYQRYDDGDGEPPVTWPYDRFEMCWGKHTCHMGVAKALKALAEIPPAARSTAAKKAVKAGAEYLLEHRIHKRSHDPAKVAKPGWLRFGFPLMYQTDVLELLGILMHLGYRDERIREAVDLVVSRQGTDGRWTLESTFNGRFVVDIERKGKPSKWVTLNALRVLKAWAA
jgi:hypothetical protein